jgi:hypothetical protein
LHKIRQATHLINPSTAPKPRRNGRDVDRRTIYRKLHASLEDTPIGVAVKMLGLQELENTTQCSVFQKHNREHTRLTI